MRRPLVWTMACALVILAAEARAQVETPAGTPADLQAEMEAEEADGRFVLRMQGGAVHQFESGLEKGGDVSVTRAFIEPALIYAFNRRNNIGVAVGYRYDGYSFDGDDGLAGLDPWDTINEFRVSTPIRWGFGERFDVLAVPTARWAAESGGDLGDGLTGGILTGFTYKFSDRLRIGPGFGAFARIERNGIYFPFLLVDWKITDSFALTTGPGGGATRGPGLTLNYTGVEDWTFALGARYEQLRFRLDDEGPAPDGVGEEEGLPVFVSASYNPLPMVRLSALAGVQVMGEMKLENSSGEKILDAELDPAPFLGLSFRVRF